MYNWTDPRTRINMMTPNGQAPKTAPPTKPQPQHPTHIPTPVNFPYTNNNLVQTMQNYANQQQANWNSSDWSAPASSSSRPPVTTTATQPAQMNPYMRRNNNPYLR